MNILLHRINAALMIQNQTFQEMECMYPAADVPAQQEVSAIVQVGTYGHFWVHWITLSFTTLDGSPAADTGIDYLRGKLIHTQNSQPVFNDFVPLHLWATPGRRKSISGSGSDSNQMFIVWEWDAMFPINDGIQIDLKNDALLATNSMSASFWGVRVKDASTTAGA